MLACPVLACPALVFLEWVCLEWACLVLACPVWCPGSAFQVRWCLRDARVSPAVLAERIPDPVTPCPQELRQPLPKQPPKQPSTVSRDLSGVIPQVLSLLIPTPGCSPVGAEAQQCLGSLGVGVRDEPPKGLNVG